MPKAPETAQQTAKIAELDPPEYQNAYQYIAALTGLSERTIRKAFKREPITWQTACKIRKHTSIPTRCFRCIEDTRGQNKKKTAAKDSLKA